METNNKRGCSLCDATWGEYWSVVENENRRFCCSTCAFAFRNMVDEVKKRTGWPTIDRIEINGSNTTGRRCLATFRGGDFRFYVKFKDDGRIHDFHSL
ncbi:MAG: TA0938 family protein [Candidatus Thermoplasmatota archaeon]|nr:TA0938 family protein [Candidatus Thermoplasmatota archaeon]MCL5437341.1 TA0938 family protein [Candidatus Thermoplasmatota archaeon]